MAETEKINSNSVQATNPDTYQSRNSVSIDDFDTEEFFRQSDENETQIKDIHDSVSEMQKILGDLKESAQNQQSVMGDSKKGISDISQFIKNINSALGDVTKGISDNGARLDTIYKNQQDGYKSLAETIPESVSESTKEAISLIRENEREFLGGIEERYEKYYKNKNVYSDTEIKLPEVRIADKGLLESIIDNLLDREDRTVDAINRVYDSNQNVVQTVRDIDSRVEKDANDAYEQRRKANLTSRNDKKDVSLKQEPNKKVEVIKNGTKKFSELLLEDIVGADSAKALSPIVDKSIDWIGDGINTAIWGSGGTFATLKAMGIKAAPAVSQSAEAVANSTQAVANSTQAVVKSTQAVAESTQAVANSANAVNSVNKSIEVLKGSGKFVSKLTAGLVVAGQVVDSAIQTYENSKVAQNEYVNNLATDEDISNQKWANFSKITGSSLVTGGTTAMATGVGLVPGAIATVGGLALNLYGKYQEDKTQADIIENQLKYESENALMIANSLEDAQDKLNRHKISKADYNLYKVKFDEMINEIKSRDLIQEFKDMGYDSLDSEKDRIFKDFRDAEKQAIETFYYFEQMAQKEGWNTQDQRMRVIQEAAAYKEKDDPQSRRYREILLNSVRDVDRIGLNLKHKGIQQIKDEQERERQIKEGELFEGSASITPVMGSIKTLDDSVSSELHNLDSSVSEDIKKLQTSVDDGFGKIINLNYNGFGTNNSAILPNAVSLSAGVLSASKMLAQASAEIDNAMTGTGNCALGVRKALDQIGVSKGVRNEYAYQWADSLAKNENFNEVTSQYDVSDLKNLPKGAVIVWGKSDAHKAGHIEVSQGNGYGTSDSYNPINEETYKKYGSYRIFMLNENAATKLNTNGESLYTGSASITPVMGSVKSLDNSVAYSEPRKVESIVYTEPKKFEEIDIEPVYADSNLNKAETRILYPSIQTEDSEEDPRVKIIKDETKFEPKYTGYIGYDETAPENNDDGKNYTLYTPDVYNDMYNASLSDTIKRNYGQNVKILGESSFSAPQYETNWEDHSVFIEQNDKDRQRHEQRMREGLSTSEYDVEPVYADSNLNEAETVETEMLQMERMEKKPETAPAPPIIMADNKTNSGSSSGGGSNSDTRIDDPMLIMMNYFQGCLG